MLPKFQVKGHAKYSVYSHIFSCFMMLIIASLIPSIVSGVVIDRVFEGVTVTNEELEGFIAGTLDKASGSYSKITALLDDYAIAQVIMLVTNVINMPFQYLLVRYFLVLAGTPADRVCSFRVFFSGMDNVSAFIKGAVIMLLLDLASMLGIIVGFFPVYLALCMAPFYFALDPKLGIFKAFSKSRALMKGHKKEAFMILLEFILVIVGAYILDFAGMSFIAFPIEALARALMLTTLAVIFVRLDKGVSAQNNDTQEAQKN